ncbi:uncharacterized protein LOC130781460 [Actinidia eriantha]|uniref:uncharacterized protein LOC130781460 n=1 Tax=Actinidia eriantha TaxID=165200 RepID=UPI002590F703|nr:uncharacterized protein LOC130781460 [Actinidia eriantha]
MIFVLFFNMITFCLESWWAQNRHNLCYSQKWAIPGRFDFGVHKTRLRKQLKRVGEEEEEDDDDLPEMESANGATCHIWRNLGDCGGRQFPLRQKREISSFKSVFSLEMMKITQLGVSSTISFSNCSGSSLVLTMITYRRNVNVSINEVLCSVCSYGCLLRNLEGCDCIRLNLLISITRLM